MRAHASLLVFCLACTGGTVASPPIATPTPPPVVAVRAPVDPDAPLVALDGAIRSGKLKNGLTYLIVDDDDVTFDETLVTLAVNAGSLDETETQKGAAHLLQHVMHAMVEDDVADPEELGVTSNDRSRFTLPLQSGDISEEAEVERKLGLLRKMADGLKLDRPKLERARNEIHDGGADEDQAPHAWESPHKRAHPPYGDAAHFTTLTEKDLAEFYRTWYRADQMAVIVVGNVDVPAVVRRIEKKFGSLAVPKTPAPAHVALAAPVPTGLAVAIEGGNSGFEIVHRIPHAHVRGEAGYRASLIDQFVRDTIVARWRQVTPRAEVETSREQFSDAVDLSRLQVNAYDVEDVRRFLREIERLRLHGIDPADLVEQQESYTANLDEPGDHDGTIEQTDALAAYFRDGRPYDGRELHAVQARLFATITPDEVNAALRANYGEATRMIVAEDWDDVTEAQLRAMNAQAATPPPEPWDQRPAVRPLMTPPTAGTITSTKEDHGMTVFTLSNGARVIVRPTKETRGSSTAGDVISDREYLRIYAIGSGGWGRLAPDAALQARFAGDLVLRGGLGDVPYDTLREAMRGRDVNLYADIRQLNHEVSVSGKPKELATMMQVMHLALARPRKDPKALDGWRTERKQLLKDNPTQPYLTMLEQLRALEGNRPTPPVSEAQLDALDLDRAYAAYADHMGDLKGTTFLVVGFVESAAIKPMIETYLASIPTTGTRITAKPIAVPKPKMPRTQVLVRPGSDHSIVFEYVADVVSGDRLLAERDLGLFAWALQNRIDTRFMREPRGYVTAAISDDGHRYLRVTMNSRSGFSPTIEKDLQAEVEKLKTTVDQGTLDTLNARYMPRATFAGSWATEVASAIGRGEDAAKRSAYLFDRDGALARIKPELVKATARRFGKPTAIVHVEPVPPAPAP